MFVELVRTTTRDGLRLDGAWRQGERTSLREAKLDAVLFLHGVGANFYTSGTLEGIAPRLLKRGLHLLPVNTRGHDNVYSASVNFGRRLQGAGFEVVDECRHDVAAWLDFLVQRGHPRVLLMGHSLGAIKAIYSQAHEPHPGVAGIVALSPPRLSHRAFLKSVQSELYFQTLTQAEQMIAAGRESDLFLAQFPFPLMITAEGYVDKYGPGERYNVLRFTPELQVPILFTYGSKEVAAHTGPFAGLPQELDDLKQNGLPLEVAIVAGGDHFYTGVYDGLAEEIDDWLSMQFPV